MKLVNKSNVHTLSVDEIVASHTHIQFQKRPKILDIGNTISLLTEDRDTEFCAPTTQNSVVNNFSISTSTVASVGQTLTLQHENYMSLSPQKSTLSASTMPQYTLMLQRYTLQGVKLYVESVTSTTLYMYIYSPKNVRVLKIILANHTISVDKWSSETYQHPVLTYTHQQDTNYIFAKLATIVTNDCVSFAEIEQYSRIHKNTTLSTTERIYPEYTHLRNTVKKLVRKDISAIEQVKHTVTVPQKKLTVSITVSLYEQLL